MTDATLHVRMLGPLQVHHPDGGLVPTQSWRTGMTMDLLRSLAVRPGAPVSSVLLAERLWPAVEPARARTSLRTAASQVRRATGVNCVVRQLGSLVLTHATSDLADHRELCVQARSAYGRGDLAVVVALVQRAEDLYVDDFHAYDDESSWAVDLRQSLRAARVALLVDGADSAARLRRPREAIRFASAAIEVDEYVEAPHRVLVESYAQIGEMNRALRAYEQCRRVLAESVGADPSPLTQAAHLRVLRGQVRPLEEPGRRS